MLLSVSMIPAFSDTYALMSRLSYLQRGCDKKRISCAVCLGDISTDSVQRITMPRNRKCFNSMLPCISPGNRFIVFTLSIGAVLAGKVLPVLVTNLGICPRLWVKKQAVEIEGRESKTCC